jgi:hypothetical protein
MFSELEHSASPLSPPSTDSIFLGIPPEIRLEIYKILLSSTYRLRPYILASCERGVKNYHSILLVNRQIYQESVDILYGTSLFSIAVVSYGEWMKSRAQMWDPEYHRWVYHKLSDPVFFV